MEKSLLLLGDLGRSCWPHTSTAGPVAAAGFRNWLALHSSPASPAGAACALALSSRVAAQRDSAVFWQACPLHLITDYTHCRLDYQHCRDSLQSNTTC